MPLGPTMSAPASTYTTAASASSGSVASLSTWPLAITPQCPWDVYSHMQTSATSTNGGITSWPGASRVSLTRERSAAVRRSRRGRSAAGTGTLRVRISSRIVLHLQRQNPRDRVDQAAHALGIGFGYDTEAEGEGAGGRARSDRDRGQLVCAAHADESAHRGARREDGSAQVGIRQRCPQWLSRFGRRLYGSVRGDLF